MAGHARRGLHGQVVEDLGTRIMRGEFKPGDIIDPNALAHELDVSRTVVREAIAVLTAKGLISARPRLGTYVTDRASWQLLDDQVMTWRAGDDPDDVLVRELGEVRLVIEPSAARMAAERRTAEQLERIGRALGDLEKTSGAADAHQHVLADLKFHTAVLAASGNELLERLEVLLEPALHARDALAHAHEPRRDYLDHHRAVYQAIEAGDPDRAQRTMQILVERAAEDTEAILAARRSERR